MQLLVVWSWQPTTSRCHNERNPMIRRSFLAYHAAMVHSQKAPIHYREAASWGEDWPRESSSMGRPRNLSSPSLVLVQYGIKRYHILTGSAKQLLCHNIQLVRLTSVEYLDNLYLELRTFATAPHSTAFADFRDLRYCRSTR